jgi:N-acetylneuraminate synthase
LANKDEIFEAIETARSGGCTELVVMHCVSSYPAPPEDYNLATIPDIASNFDVLAGISDHTIDNTTAISSVMLGACMIEKHVTIDRKGGGPDDSFSLEENELKRLCTETKIAWKALGSVNYAPKASESSNLGFRRSLYAVEDIKVGEIFTKRNVKSIRPGFGLAPKHLPNVLGKIAKTDICRGTALNTSLVDITIA